MTQITQNHMPKLRDIRHLYLLYAAGGCITIGILLAWLLLPVLIKQSAQEVDWTLDRSGPNNAQRIK